jgi:hypothetical protein
MRAGDLRFLLALTTPLAPLALAPPLWFRVMNPRVRALE